MEFGGTKNDVAKLSPGGFLHSQTVSMLLVSEDNWTKISKIYAIRLKKAVDLKYIFVNVYSQVHNASPDKSDFFLYGK